MGVAAGDDRQFELFGQRVGQPLGARAVQGDVLAVQVQEGQALELFDRLFRHMPRRAEGVSAADGHRVLVEQVHQLRKGEKVSLCLVGGKAAVELEDCFQRADRQDVAALGDVGLHAGEDAQPVFQLQAVARPPAD